MREADVRCAPYTGGNQLALNGYYWSKRTLGSNALSSTQTQYVHTLHRKTHLTILRLTGSNAALALERDVSPNELALAVSRAEIPVG